MQSMGSTGGALVRGDDGVRRCFWGASTPDYVAYHDDEWGRPVVDDVRLFEKISLEGFQSGLSWLTILRKREGFRAAFAGFDPARVARYGERDIQRLLGDPGIVRHRGKIEATIANARATLAVQEERGSLASLLWSYEVPRRAAPREIADIVSSSPESISLSKALKSFGFRFVGPTTAYAAMQAMGVVNDHLVGCVSRGPCSRARKQLVIP
jgi:DNA-3-methyladenine glycosylase I